MQYLFYIGPLPLNAIIYSLIQFICFIVTKGKRDVLLLIKTSLSPFNLKVIFAVVFYKMLVLIGGQCWLYNKCFGKAAYQVKLVLGRWTVYRLHRTQVRYHGR